MAFLRRLDDEEEALSEPPPLYPESTMLMGRITEAVLPPSLLDETLCKFRYNVAHIEPTVRDFDDFYALNSGMSMRYAKEADRLDSLNNILRKILPASPKPGSLNGYKNSGELGVTVDYSLLLLYYFQQVKNEVTDCLNDPNSQIYSYYIRHVARCDRAGVGKCANYPAILLCQIGEYIFRDPSLVVLIFCQGPYFIVSVVVFTSQPNIEQIACISLHTHRSNEDQIEAGARVVAALRIASRELKEKYPSLVKSETSQAEYPFPRSFVKKGGKGGETARVAFTYTHETDDNVLRKKKVFHARVDMTGKRICVKFTQRYSEAAHEAGVELGIAPDLLAVERIGQWYMVVMEDVSEQYSNLYQVKEDVYDQRSVEKLVKEAIESLHRKGFVHGDVRHTNIMIDNKLVKGARNRSRPILLVDWDWAGTDGEVKYPVTLNSSVLRPKGAYAGEKIEASHDLEMAGWIWI